MFFCASLWLIPLLGQGTGEPADAPYADISNQKIGVGVLRKPVKPPVRGFFTYEIVDHGNDFYTVAPGGR